MEISIIIEEGRSVPLKVVKGERIMDIKKAIWDKIGLPIEEQILVHQRRVLDNNKSVDEYLIKENSVIDVLIQKRINFQIYVKTMDGKALILDAASSDRIIDIKMKIQEKIGVETYDQILVYNGGVLEDVGSVDEYHIDAMCVIECLVESRNRIFVKTMKGKAVALTVLKGERIGDLMKKIEEKLGLPCDGHKLVYQGILLRNSKTVDDYHISKKSIIDVVAKLRNGIKIFVKTMDGYIVQLEMTNGGEIIDIKKKVHEKIGLLPDEQELVYKGILLDDGGKMSDYNIEEKSVIDVVVVAKRGMEIFAKAMNGHVVTLQVTKTDRLADVRNRIKEKLQILADEQKLVCDGVILKDDGFVDDYQIYEKSVIDVVTLLRDGILIFAKTRAGEEVILEVIKTDRIVDVKKMIEGRMGILPDGQRLIYQEEILDDDGTVDDYEIDEMGVINIVLPSK